MNVSMPASRYCWIVSSTVSGLPTIAVPGPGRTSPRPAHRFGWISRSRTSSGTLPPCSAVIRCWPTESVLPNILWIRPTDSGSMWSIRSLVAAQAASSVSRVMM